jgi:hypothetical protein
MHFHPILLVQADDLEEAKIKAEDFCDTESGEHSYFDYGGIVPDTETDFNKPLSEVKPILPGDDHIALARNLIAEAEQCMREGNHGHAGYCYRRAGLLLEQLFFVDYPLYNIDRNDYSREYSEGWYAIEADFHF